MLSVSYISRESWVLSHLSLCSFRVYANNRIHYGPTVVFVCLHFTLPHYHHYADDLNVLNFLNTRQVPSVECVSKIKSILAIIFHAIYGAVCIQLTHFSYGDCKNMCTLFYCHDQK